MSGIQIPTVSYNFDGKNLHSLFFRYASTRRIVSELINARTELIGSLVASFYAHDDLLQKASKGLEFYSKLNANVSKVGDVKVNIAVEDLPPFLPFC